MQARATCPTCGADNPQGKVFCEACGSAMIVKTASATPQAQQNVPLPPPPTPPGVTQPVQSSTQPHPSSRPPIAAPGSWPRAAQTAQPTPANAPTPTTATGHPHAAPSPPGNISTQTQNIPTGPAKATLNLAGKTAAPPPKMGQSSTHAQVSTSPGGQSPTISAPSPKPATTATIGTTPAKQAGGSSGASNAWAVIIFLLVVVAIVVAILWATGVIFKSRPIPGSNHLYTQQSISRIEAAPRQYNLTLHPQDLIITSQT